MNDYLDEDIKFDEELLHRDDDSLKSSASTASLESNEDAEEAIQTPTTTDKPSIKTLFKSNVKKIMNTLKISKPNNPIDNHSSPIKNQNISDMLDSLSQSFDDETYINNTATIYETNNNLNDTIYVDKLEEVKDRDDTIVADTIGLNLTHNIEIIESINDHKLDEQIRVSETIPIALDLKQMVNIFNTNENEKDDPEDDEVSEEDVKEPNNKKKRNKKKKKT
jgi:hypothetical protein